MKSNKELREEARGIMKRGWFWRLLIVGVALQFMAYLVTSLLGRWFTGMGIQTWTDFLLAKAQAINSGMDLSIPSMHMALQMLGASLFSSFIAYIFAAIVAFGFAGAALRAAKDDDSRWFAASFGGFGRPFEVAWLMALMNLKVALWSLLFFFPGLIAIYRYRQAWYLKNENPDWSAAKCIAESSRMMRGFKWRAFVFDCSYLWWVFVAWLVLGIAAGVTVAGRDSLVVAAIGSLVGVFALWLVMYVLIYFLLGRAVFYKGMKDDATAD